MNLRLLTKIVAVALLSLLLLAPLTEIRSLVSERSALRDRVVAEMAEGYGRPQTVLGPLLIVPFEKTLRQTTLATKDLPAQVVETVERGNLTIFPTVVEARSVLSPGERRRGIYRAQVYESTTRIEARFEIPENYGVVGDLRDFRFGVPEVLLGVSDLRGLEAGLELRWNERTLSLEPGLAGVKLGVGVHAPIGERASDVAEAGRLEIDLPLRGSASLQLVPFGKKTRFEVKSAWPHPSFTGAFLPSERDVSAAGFRAAWTTTALATGVESSVQACIAAGAECGDLATERFGVSLIDPVDHYVKVDRASKYAFLFIGLTFALFFLSEVLGRGRVHPVQYGLVGMALSIFFLLLLSLAEHIGFAMAYAISALACVGLATFYVAHFLSGWGATVGFGAGLGAVYGLLYVILSAEDFALLFGSGLVFGVLVVLMVATRRVDWERFGSFVETAVRSGGGGSAAGPASPSPGGG